ncbi:MAG: hypothetical protein H6737_09380 [Alphaproteobacteria bacterium]|nr:hypothetical protein [Alphaproteobacteria bacterium]
MTCEETREALLEGGMDEIDALEPHLATCVECRALADRIRAHDATIGRALDGFARREGFDAAFQQAVAQVDRADAPPALRSRWSWVAAAGLAAAAVAIVVSRALPTAVEDVSVEDVAEPAASALPPDPGKAAVEEADRARERARAAVDEARRLADERALASDGADLTPLEPVALLGSLAAEDVATLDAWVEDMATPPNDRDRASRMLIVNAFAAGQTVEWERLVHRHLTTLPDDDPDLAYKYALHLSKKGVAVAEDVIRWSDVALDRRAKWTGNTYMARVYSLYKIRAGAAQKLWQAAEDAQARTPSDATRSDASVARVRTKRFAREWLDFTRTTPKDASVPQALCLSAATDPADCE